MPAETFLSVRKLGRRFTARRWFGRETSGPWAFRDISFDLGRGRTLGLVGPSGSGKTTLARCVALFDPPTCGEILLDGRNVWDANRRDRGRLRSEIQLIAQQPAAALNPRFTAGEIVAEPLLVQRLGTKAWRRRRAAELMEMTGLDPRAAGNRALEFSGGERQRLAIARALALDPRLLILDESLSGLDVSVQAQIANLLLDLQARLGVTYILISHDRSLVERIADEIAILEEGGIAQRPAAGAGA
ncbi:MAG: dipeptide/oligopeptide/nickel ABC transporter ATP-binding protein [Acidobacteriia bacterium]|nr:dipeptide/oligopeptide/nickel ABC transporter ATP-binding protein [Terriglobia bacterium]